MMVLNRSTIKKLLYFEIIFILCFQGAISLLKFPSYISYTLDIINVVIFGYLLLQHSLKQRIKDAGLLTTYKYLVIVIVIFILTSLFNLVSPLLVIWGMRNTFRFIPFFLACCLYLQIKDIEKIFSLMMKLQILNVVLTIYQYFVTDCWGDHLGGIFGTSVGCNAYTNIFFCALIIYYLIGFIHKKVELSKLILLIGSCFLVASLAEIKIFFLEFVIIVVLSILMNKPSIRVITITSISIAALFAGLYIFYRVFPSAFADLIDLDRVVQYSTGIITGYNISRLGAFSEINIIFFKNDVLKNLFGYGFGNCEYSNISLFSSKFYNMYGGYNYRWFTHQMLFLETGYVGFFVYCMFFLSIIISAYNLSKSNDSMLGYAALITILFTVITIINFWYNCGILVECAGISYFVLSIFFVVFKNRRE